jgi:uncharacterized protein YecE (DUF72 family)
MTLIRIGTGPLPFRFDRYFSTFGAVEMLDAGREPIRLKVLRRLKQRAPEGFVWTLAAWHWLTDDPLDAREAPPFDLSARDIGFFRDTPANARLWEEVRLQVEALQPTFLLFRTPSSFTPTETNRDAMRAFHERWLKALPCRIIWEARGIWTLDETRAFCDELGWIAAVDPYADFELPPIPSAETWYYLNGPRGKREFSQDDFEDLVDFISGHTEPVNLVFRGPDRERNALALQRRFPEGEVEHIPFLPAGIALDDDDSDVYDDDDEDEEYDDDLDGEDDEDEDEDA